MKQRTFTPYRTLLTVVILLFLLEAAVMAGINYLQLPPTVEAVLDASALITLALPVLYVMFIRPMIQQYEQNARLYEQLQYAHTQLHTLVQKTVMFQEHERRYLAKALYDGIGQSTASALLQAQLLSTKQGSPEAFAAQLSNLENELSEISKSLHELANNLRPASLDFLGLQSGVQQYIDQLQEQNSVEIHFEKETASSRLPEVMEVAFFRIAQEALTNAVRHSKASRIEVLLQQNENQATLIVEDNGEGFTLDTIEWEQCFGLLDMRERAEMLGGDFSIETAPGKGTTVRVSIPTSQYSV